MRRFATFGLILTVLLTGTLEAAPKKTRKKPKTKSTATAPAQRDDWPSLVNAVSPLIDSYETVGPASMRVQMNAEVWNSLSSDQQRQLCDVLASKQAVQSMRRTLHLYVYETEVGTIGPGWLGEWRFRRE